MAFEIVERTVGGETDKRAVVDNLHTPLVRTMSVGSNWTKIWIAVRFSTTRTTTWIPMPKFYFGLCSGKSAPPGSTTPNHFVGLTPNTARGFSFDSTDYFQMGLSGSTTTSAAYMKTKIEAGSETTVITNAAATLPRYQCVYKAPVGHTGTIIQLEKLGGTSWKISGSMYTGTSSPGCTLSNFNEALNAPSLPNGSGWQIIPFDSGVDDITVDESTYGDLDSVCFTFLSTINPFEISDIAYVVLA